VKVTRGSMTTKTRTTVTETYETSENGWSWNASVNAWFFQGSISKNTPSSSKKVTTTETISLPCCVTYTFDYMPLCSAPPC